MHDKIRVGFIGAGRHAARAHYPSLASFPDVELKAICDLNEERLKSIGDLYGIEYRFRNYIDMLETVSLDAVYVVMSPIPTDFYADAEPMTSIVIECLKRGLHVFIEKPPGISSSEAKRMAETARRYKCRGMVGFNRRFIPVFRRAKSIVEGYGQITHCLAIFHKNALSETQPWGSVSYLVADVIHAVDALRFIGGEPIKVSSYASSFYVDYLNSFNALIVFDNGCVGHLCSNYSSGGRVHYFEIHSKGIWAMVDLPLDPPEKQIAYILKDNKPYGEAEVIRNLDLVGGSRDFHITYGFLQEDRHFIDCIKNDMEPETSLDDAVKTMELVELIASSTMR
ncbi:MAG: Gfo/Idh/MocA family oxidoreductase [Nitrososphaerota archaeon]|nr:Gfo/Idh/MocA family oxidoreductase [Candidatus Bathyarchaeota archaeon]MCX8162718.1 Gfo/Idh/MocA family oxidoreductase [Candidatus Bathyarchaeota archaeon]MDW8061992.1 Gfo/Idh/MocA family oxidoreductase [Nitrososphaerota archaeon]